MKNALCFSENTISGSITVSSSIIPTLAAAFLRGPAFGALPVSRKHAILSVSSGFPPETASHYPGRSGSVLPLNSNSCERCPHQPAHSSGRSLIRVPSAVLILSARPVKREILPDVALYQRHGLGLTLRLPVAEVYPHGRPESTAAPP